MKKYLITFFSLLIFPLLVWAAVDTWDGQTQIDTWDGQTQIDTSDGVVHVSGTIGTEIYDNSFVTYDIFLYHSSFQPLTPGNINKAKVYVAGHNGKTVCLGIYDSVGNRLATGTVVPATDDAGWVEVDLSSTIDLQADTDYYLGYQVSSDGGSLHQELLLSNTFYDSTGGYDCTLDPMSEEESTLNIHACSIYMWYE